MTRLTHRVRLVVRCGARLPILAAFLLLSSFRLTCMAGDATFAKDLEKVLNDMESASTILQRDSAARALYSLVGFVDVEREEVDPKLITRIVAQLNTDEDNVRIWVAMTLGSLGPRAKEAAPKLLEILPQVDCARASLNSAPAIRIALERMGVTPPARNCQGINGERSN